MVQRLTSVAPYERRFWTIYASKHLQFEELIRLHLDICEAISSRTHWGYCYIDMNAGPGFDPKNPQDLGSPLRALRNIVPRFPNARVLLCEEELVTFMRLSREVQSLEIPHNRIGVEFGDHADIVPAFAERQLTHRPLGILFHDPNGIPDFELLERLSRMPEFSRMDFLIYIQAAPLKRARMAFGKHLTLKEHLTAIHKEYWIIRRPEGRHQFTFALGMNRLKIGDWKNRGFLQSDSDEGRWILERLSLTHAERHRAQLSLELSDD